MFGGKAPAFQYISDRNTGSHLGPRRGRISETRPKSLRPRKGKDAKMDYKELRAADTIEPF